MKKILFLLFVSLAAFGQRNGLIDADTTTRPRAGLSALAFSSGQLKIVRNSGNSYGIITSNNTYANPGWLSSIALAKVTGLDTSIFLRKTTASSLYVPYTGSNKSTNLGEYAISAGQLNLDTTPTQTLGVGGIRWNDTDGTVDLRLKGNNVTLQIGQEQVLRAVNGTGANLLESDYKAVRVIGAQGQRLQVAFAQANAELTSRETIGLVTENINNNQEGFITVSGIVNEINTTGALQGESWADGDMLYLSANTAVQLTKVKPTAPNHMVIVGYVVYAHAVHGKIYVKVNNGYELEELHDVLPTPYVNNGVLYRDTGANLWRSATIPSLLGYTPYSAANPAGYITSGAIAVKSDTSHTHTTAKITDWTAAWSARFAAQSTSGLAEGSNLYYTNARVGTYGDARYGQLASANSWTGSNIMSPTLSGTSGTVSALTISPTITQSSTAGYRGLFISPFEQSTGSGAKLPLDVGTNSAANGAGTHTSRFSVASNGEINFGTLGRMFSNGNFFLGSSPVDAGYKLDVGGTSQFRGTMFFGGLNLVTSGGTFDFSNSVTTQGNIRGLTGVSAGTTSPPVNSAIAEFVSTTRGFLPPRMTQAQRNAISSPAPGLTLYCTDCTATDTSTGVMQTYNGSTWKNNW